jgi:hypothetical protein
VARRLAEYRLISSHQGTYRQPESCLPREDQVLRIPFLPNRLEEHLKPVLFTLRTELSRSKGRVPTLV